MKDSPNPDRAEKLENGRLRLERQKLALDVLLKRRELSRPTSSILRDIFTNPLTLAIAGGVITLMTQIITSSINSSAQLKAETQRAELARAADDRQAKAAESAAAKNLQAELIKKFAEAPDLETARGNLEFLIGAGLLPDYEEKIREYLQKNPKGGPLTGPATTRLSRQELKDLIGGPAVRLDDKGDTSISIDDPWYRANLVTVEIP